MAIPTRMRLFGLVGILRSSATDAANAADRAESLPDTPEHVALRAQLDSLAADAQAALDTAIALERAAAEASAA